MTSRRMTGLALESSNPWCPQIAQCHRRMDICAGRPHNIGMLIADVTSKGSLASISSAPKTIPRTTSVHFDVRTVTRARTNAGAGSLPPTSSVAFATRTANVNAYPVKQQSPGRRNADDLERSLARTSRSVLGFMRDTGRRHSFLRGSSIGSQTTLDWVLCLATIKYPYLRVLNRW